MKFELAVNNGEFILDEKVTHIRRITDVHKTEAKEIDEFRSLDDLDSLVGKLVEVWFVGGYYARFYVWGAFFNTISRTYVLSVATTHDGKMKHKRKRDITIGEYITRLNQEEIKNEERDEETYNLLKIDNGLFIDGVEVKCLKSVDIKSNVNNFSEVTISFVTKTDGLDNVAKGDVFKEDF